MFSKKYKKCHCEDERSDDVAIKEIETLNRNGSPRFACDDRELQR